MFPDGFKFEIVPDGFKFEMVPDGFKFEMVPDGFKFEIVPGGFKFEMVPDGFKFEMVPGGFKFEIGSSWYRMFSDEGNVGYRFSFQLNVGNVVELRDIHFWKSKVNFVLNIICKTNIYDIAKVLMPT